MIFSNLKLNKNEPIYIQIKNHVIDSINKGDLKKDSKLPSTREVSKFLSISRNSVIAAYEELESENIIATKRGIGTFVLAEGRNNSHEYFIDYSKSFNKYAYSLKHLHIIKSELPYKKNMISFKSIAPDSSLFNLDDFKRCFLDAFAYEGPNLLNYGYAKGYKPLIDYLFSYMEDKGVNSINKDILITNGFTEALHMILSSLTSTNDIIVCEKPTHNTALKIMKSLGLEIIQVELDAEGMNLKQLENTLENNNVKFGYLIPSYNNPTGIVTKVKRRKEIYNLFRKYSVPIIEDGFNEELLYSSSPIEPIASLSGEGNGVVYIGSLSKILFPGLRIGWIHGDAQLIETLESVKRGINIHSSFLDQSTFYYYLKNGSFNKHIKNVRKYYKDKYNLVMEMIEKHIPYESVLGEGGLHVFIKLKNNLNARELLELCYNDNVLFMPGDIFYKDFYDTNGLSIDGINTFRIGFGKVSDEDIITGIKIISKNIRILENNLTKSSDNK